MRDIDNALARLATAPVHPGLDDLDSALAAAIAAHPAGQGSSGMIGSSVFAACVALMLGIVSAMPGEASATRTGHAPFGATQALAPSTLLAGG